MVVILSVSFLGHYYFERIEQGIPKCGAGLYSRGQALADSRLPQDVRRGILQCYCLANGSEELCSEFLLQKYAVPALGAWITIGNMLISVVFTWLGITKRSKDSAATHGAVMKSIFFCQYLNTVVLVLLAHHSFSPSGGMFDDFTNRWYLRVGSALIISQCAMIFVPHMFTLLQSFILFCRRCWDRKCTRSTKKTRKLIQDDYENLYTGPPFLLHVRYAQVLSTLFISLTFSSGMPILYPISALILFTEFWVNKYLVFRFYRRTPDYTKELSQSVV